jgi:uncharacterized protein YlxW (UPF0749 family)
MTHPAGAPPEPRTYAPNFLLELFAHPLDPGYADAAARRARQAAASGRAPTPTGTARPTWHGAYPWRMAVLVVIGVLLATAYREAVTGAPERGLAHAGLVREVKQAQARTDDLQRRADDLRQQVSQARTSALAGSGAELDRLRQQEAATGFGVVTGDGVVVSLSDAPAPVDPTTGRRTNADVNRVLDIDLQNVVNALWAGGAEAVAVNGQRLTATSAIRTAGSAVLVDFRPVTSPYEVVAIGPPDLRRTFDATVTAATMRGLVDHFGLGFATRSASGLRLPAAADVPLRYAQPTPSKGPR